MFKKNVGDFPALGLIELSSIARGFIVSDVMVKKAPIELLLSQPISSGKYLVMIAGEVASVQESLQAGREASETHLVDDFFIPQLHTQVGLTLNGRNGAQKNIEALGIVETRTVASAILASDAALKTADVHLVELRLGQGIGGKGYFVFSGALPDVQAAHEGALNVIKERGTLLRSEIVTSAHDDVRQLCI